MWSQSQITINTPGRSSIEITHQLTRMVINSGIHVGLLHCFIQHTSASLIICENADPNVRQDLEMVMGRLAPDGDPDYRHQDEGPDDMPAHIRSILTQTELSIPVQQGQVALGTWQGVYLWEHRLAAQRRTIILTVHGEQDS